MHTKTTERGKTLTAIAFSYFAAGNWEKKDGLGGEAELEDLFSISSWLTLAYPAAARSPHFPATQQISDVTTH